MTPERRKFIQDLYIRVCRDSGFKMEYTRAAHFAGKVGGFHAMDVWTAMPSLQVMEQIAKGEHPAAHATQSPPPPIGASSMSEIKPELVERMVEVLRGYVAGSCAMAYGPNEDRSVYAEAVAIVSELPEPVDPDWIEAGKINDWSPYDLTEMDPRAAQRVVEQVRDAILAGIKRGRELATPSPEIERLGGVGV